MPLITVRAQHYDITDFRTLNDITDYDTLNDIRPRFVAVSLRWVSRPMAG